MSDAGREFVAIISATPIIIIVVVILIVATVAVALVGYIVSELRRRTHLGWLDSLLGSLGGLILRSLILRTVSLDTLINLHLLLLLSFGLGSINPPFPSSYSLELLSVIYSLKLLSFVTHAACTSTRFG